MKFFRSQVGSGSREQDLGFSERMIFFKSLSEIRSKSVKELRQDSAVKSTLNLGTGCTERPRLKVIILNSYEKINTTARVKERCSHVRHKTVKGLNPGVISKG